jgi:hypothetical protein
MYCRPSSVKNTILRFYRGRKRENEGEREREREEEKKVVLDKSMLYDATIVIIETQMHKKISY